MNYRRSSFLIEALLVGPDTCWIIECQCKYFRSGPRTQRKNTVFPCFVQTKSPAFRGEVQDQVDLYGTLKNEHGAPKCFTGIKHTHTQTCQARKRVDETKCHSSTQIESQ